MAWSKEELDALKRDKNLPGFEHIFAARNVASIEESGQYRVVRAVSQIRLLGCCIEAERLEELRKALTDLCLDFMLIEDKCLAEIDDVRPLSPSPVLEMVMDQDGEFRPFVTSDSVSEMLVMNGVDEVVAMTQGNLLMKGLVLHMFRHHEEYSKYFCSKFKTSPCSCPLKRGSAKRARARQSWEQATIPPDAFLAFANQDRQTIKDALNRDKGEEEFTPFGPKRLRLLKDIAIRITNDLCEA